MRVTALRQDVLSVVVSPDGVLPEDASWAVLPEARKLSVEVKPLEEALSVGFRTAALDVRIERNPLRLVVRDVDGNVICADAAPAIEFPRSGFAVFKEMPGDEHFYGLGDKTGSFDRRNQAYTLWNTDTLSGIRVRGGRRPVRTPPRLAAAAAGAGAHRPLDARPGRHRRLRPSVESADRPPRPQAGQHSPSARPEGVSPCGWPTSASAEWRPTGPGGERARRQPRQFSRHRPAGGAHAPVRLAAAGARRVARPRDDVYALGVIWHQLLTGSLTAGRPGGIARGRTVLSPPARLAPRWSLLWRRLEDEPADRPADAGVLSRTPCSSARPTGHRAGSPDASAPGIDLPHQVVNSVGMRLVLHPGRNLPHGLAPGRTAPLRRRAAGRLVPSTGRSTWASSP